MKIEQICLWMRDFEFLIFFSISSFFSYTFYFILEILLDRLIKFCFWFSNWIQVQRIFFGYYYDFLCNQYVVIMVWIELFLECVGLPKLILILRVVIWNLKLNEGDQIISFFGTVGFFSLKYIFFLLFTFSVSQYCCLWKFMRGASIYYVTQYPIDDGVSGICTVLCYYGEGDLGNILLRNIWMLPKKKSNVTHS